MSSLSSNLPISASFLPWCQKSSSATTTNSTTTSRRNSPLQLPPIQSFGQYPTPAIQWRDSDAFDSYESSPIADDNSSPPSPMDQSHPATPATNAMYPPSYLPRKEPSPSSSSLDSNSAAAPAANHWFWVGPHPSAQAIAEKTCEMICYFWFSNTLGAPKNSPHYREPIRSSRRSQQQRSNNSNNNSSYSPSEPPCGLSDATTAALQFTPSPQFVHFMQKLLQTTQVSQSVIVLSLHYIYRLKEENHFTNGKAGSEFRVAVVALMLANKFIDDNTYTNKTWSDVSGIELQEINKMEREFLRGVDFRLYVNTDTYKAWVKLLEGLVAIKERDQQQWHYSRRHDTTSLHAPIPRLSAPDCTTHHHHHHHHHQPRARSSSPLPSLKASYPFTFVAPNNSSSSGSEAIRSRARPPIPPPSVPGVKRPAIVAFSPTSLALQGGPSKRPISLNMSLVRPIQGPVSAGSAYPLTDFAKLSLNKSNNTTPSRLTPAKTKQQSTADNSQTLAAAYTLQDRIAGPDPQHLYYYTLASSPTHSESDNRVHKAFLRSHLPQTYQPPSSYLHPPAQIHHPIYTQSASASPVHPLPSCRYLPSYHHHPHNNHHQHHQHHYPQQHYMDSHGPSYASNNSNYSDSLALPPIRVRDSCDDDSSSSLSGSYSNLPSCQLPRQSNRVPVAPFANAGPPGVHWPSQYAQPHGYPHMRYSISQSHFAY
ncbi:hypothetical protein Clacol_008096 [Clathrus columnatus]|uniref:Cyclin-like domain-containing protein n=1 Tax=Clathrus columnatus TaxID=1419009 RepID=A0AAV5AM95_9AGAM|nr:hypothetical protein Clacol_008096 [Clathrus columnatus]